MQFSLRAGSVIRAVIGAAIGVGVLVIGIVLHKRLLDIIGVVYILWCVALWYRRRNPPRDR
jgi:threonine/homoserine/homoserine lactone efflux protein